MQLSELQPALFKQFSNVLQNNKLHHAFLFSGGFGTMAMAIWLAQSRFCRALDNGLPCGNCRECRLVADNDFTDLHVIEPDGQTIKTQQIRELLMTFSQSGFEGNRQVVIIDGADKMHSNAANALLKSIEEPESEIYIFLLAASENLVLETIKSRTQMFKFPEQTLTVQKILQEEGMLKTDAILISEIVSSIEEAILLAKNNSFLESIKQAEIFVKHLDSNQTGAFLHVSTLAPYFKDKTSQALLFKMLAVLLVKRRRPALVEKVFIAQKYWQSNVNFQSCLEKLILG